MPSSSGPEKPGNNTAQVQELELWVLVANGLSLALIFICRQFLPLLFHELGRFIFPPFNAAANLVRGFIALYEANRDGYKKPSLILRAIVAMVTGMGVAIAVIGSLIATATFAVAGHILAIASFGLRTLYNLGCAIYYGLDYYFNRGNVESKTKAIANVINAVATAFNAIAIALVMVAIYFTGSIIGIASGAITALFAFYKLWTLNRPAKTDSTGAPPPPPASLSDAAPAITRPAVLSPSKKAEEGFKGERQPVAASVVPLNHFRPAPRALTPTLAPANKQVLTCALV